MRERGQKLPREAIAAVRSLGKGTLPFAADHASPEAPTVGALTCRGRSEGVNATGLEFTGTSA